MKSTLDRLTPRLWRGRLGASCCVAVLASLFGASVSVRAYDPPEIGPGLFAADGIFLAPEDRSSLLEALAAIASNFSSNARVDDDLREKALALALRLDPLHFHSRIAHRELAKGVTPPPTAFFDSLASVSETLWTIGNRLADPPLDPEEQRLARYLLELSLLTHPEPPADRLEIFAAVCDREAPEWGTALTLQRDANRTTERAHALFRESVERLREKRRETSVAKRSEPADGTPAGTPGPGAAPVRPPRMAQPQIEPVTVSLATVRKVVGVESRPAGGTITLTLRGPANGTERDLVQGQAASPNLPLVPSDEDLPLNEFALPATALGGQAWMEGAVGEVRFTPATVLPGPRRLLRADAALPALILAGSALAKTPVNDSFVLLGEIDPASLQVSLPDDALACLEAAASLGRPYVLVPATVGESLVAYLQRSNQLELLLQSELIAYTDLADAASRLTATADPALVSASAVFDKIREVSRRSDPATRVAPQDLARIASAQEMLRGILAGYPAHLSAWAMLEYGTRPVTTEILLSQFSSKVDQVVDPFLALEDNAEDVNGLAAQIEQCDALFLKLRAETPIEARDLLGTAEDLIEAAERYLELTNRTSSIGEQRLRELRTAIADFKTERSKLGLESASSL